MDVERNIVELSCSFSTFCTAECKSKCCFTGFLPLQLHEKLLFSQDRIDERDHYSLEGGCEHLNKITLRCMIYDKRPFMCRSYPFLLKYKTLYIYTSCQAIQENVIQTFPSEYTCVEF